MTPQLLQSTPLTKQMDFSYTTHANFMIVIYGMVMNLGVLAIMFRRYWFSFYIHAIIGWLCIGASFYGILIYLIPKWINSMDPFYSIHKPLGFAVLIVLFFQLLSGIAAKKIQESPSVSTKTVLRVKLAHQLISYLSLLGGKYQYLSQLLRIESDVFWAFAAYEVICLGLYLYWKFFYTKMTQTITEKQLSQSSSSNNNIPSEVKQILNNTQSEIPFQKYVIFADHIYNLENFSSKHPGGEYILNIMNQREIDRFLYGMYSAQLTPNVKIHQHSASSLKLVGPPVAKLNRLSPVNGLQELNQMRIYNKQPLNVDSDSTNNVYLLYLMLDNLTHTQTTVRFNGYSETKQFGQYFALNIDDKVTRLYTSVWCMRKSNIRFMEENFPLARQNQSDSPNASSLSSSSSSTVFLYSYLILQGKRNKKKKVPIKDEIQDHRQSLASMNEEGTLKRNEEVVPLMIKKYSKGKVTPQLLSTEWNGKLTLSQPRGGGMLYEQLPTKGKVVIMTGGTGIYPFLDFIDALFKHTLIKQGHSTSSHILSTTPVSSKDLIKSRQFVLLSAFESLSDLPMLSLFQISHLCQSKAVDFTCKFRITKGEDIQLCKNRYAAIELTKGYFDETVRLLIHDGNLAKMYICGSPSFNACLGKVMIESEVEEELYQFM